MGNEVPKLKGYAETSKNKFGLKIQPLYGTRLISPLLDMCKLYFIITYVNILQQYCNFLILCKFTKNIYGLLM